MKEKKVLIELKPGDKEVFVLSNKCLNESDKEIGLELGKENICHARNQICVGT